MSEPVSFAVALLRDQIVTANDHKQWRANAERMATLRGIGARTWTLAGKPRWDERVQIEVAVIYPDRRRRDASNFNPTVKALIDGMTNGPIMGFGKGKRAIWQGSTQGMLPDDSDEWVDGPFIRKAGIAENSQGVHTFTFTIRSAS